MGTDSRQSDRPSLEAFGLTEARYRELSAAYRGAQSVLWLLLFGAFNLAIILPMAPKVEGALLTVGLVALSLLTSLLLMLFFSGAIRAVAGWWLDRLHRDFQALRRYERALRARPSAQD